MKTKYLAYCLIIVFILNGPYSEASAVAPPHTSENKKNAWLIEKYPIEAYFNCSIERIYNFWPVAACRTSITIQTKPDEYRTPKMHQKLTLKEFMNTDRPYKRVGRAFIDGKQIKASPSTYGNSKSFTYYYDKYHEFQEEPSIMIDNTKYALEGYNNYISEIAPIAIMNINKEASHKRTQVLIGLSIALVALMAIFATLYYLIPRCWRKIKSKVNSIHIDLKKSRENKRIQRIVIDETVLSSIRGTLKKNDLSQDNLIRDEIIKAVEEGDTELAKKLTQLLKDNREDERDR